MPEGGSVFFPNVGEWVTKREMPWIKLTHPWQDGQRHKRPEIKTIMQIARPIY